MNGRRPSSSRQAQPDFGVGKRRTKDTLNVHGIATSVNLVLCPLLPVVLAKVYPLNMVKHHDFEKEISNFLRQNVFNK